MRRLLALSILIAACSPQHEAANDPADVNNGATIAAPAEPAMIPANFHGLWAEDDAACGELTHHSRLTVTGNSVRYPAFVLAVETATQPAPLALAVKGYSKQTKAPTEAHFSIDPTGNILTDQGGGGAVRVRCT